MAITKGLSLIGAGSANTVIASNVSQFLIDYNPSNKSANLLFRVSGFTFDLTNSTSHSGINLSSGNTTIHQTKVRIDHNRFINLETVDTQMHYIFHAGVYGVVDNNYFGETFYPIRTPSAAQNDGGKAVWNNWDGIIFGATDDNMYFEDNTFALRDYGQGFALTDCQEGGRYAFRYNTITLNGSGQMFDMHGNNGQQYSCMGGELYGNNIVSSSAGQFLDQRGGKVFVFGNNFGVTGFSVQIREEQDDSATPVNYVGSNPPQYPQHVNGSYYWNNRAKLTGALVSYGIGPQTVNSIPSAGRDFFTDTSSPGVGCGTLANRPAVCSTGQGYWATNQSCTDLTGMVGVNPATPISGTLYKCASTNTWVSVGSPLPYPHPLRVEASPSTLIPPFLYSPTTSP